MNIHLCSNTILYKISIPSYLLYLLPYLNFPKFISIKCFTPWSFKTLSLCSSLTVNCSVLKFQFEHIFSLHQGAIDRKLSEVGMVTWAIDGIRSSINIFNLKSLDDSIRMLRIFWIAIDEKGFPYVIRHYR